MWWIPLAVAGAQATNNVMMNFAQGLFSKGSKGNQSTDAYDMYKLNKKYFEKTYDYQLPWLKEQFYTNIDMQKQFAQMGIQWTAEDARKAGINPLAAIGHPSFSPSMSSPSGGSANMYAVPERRTKGLARAFEVLQGKLNSFQAGQMAMEILKSKKELEWMDLQIEKERNGGTGNVTVIDGEINKVPANISSEGKHAGIIAGVMPGKVLKSDEEGNVRIVTDPQISEAMESSFVDQGADIFDRVSQYGKHVGMYNMFRWRKAIPTIVTNKQEIYDYYSKLRQLKSAIDLEVKRSSRFYRVGYEYYFNAYKARWEQMVKKSPSAIYTSDD